MSALTDLFTNIAAAIRSKTGDAGTIVASNFPSAISSLVTLAGGSADATATEANVLAGSTFYAQGVKKTGTLPEKSHTPGTVYSTDANGNFGIIVPERGIYPVGTILWYPASVAGITPEKILQGESILGVAGTGEKSGNFVHKFQSSHYVESNGPFTLSTLNIGTTGLRVYYGDSIYMDSSGNLAISNPQYVEAHHNGDYQYHLKNTVLPFLNSGSAGKYLLFSHTYGAGNWTGIIKIASPGCTADGTVLTYTKTLEMVIVQDPARYFVTDTVVETRRDVNAAAFAYSDFTKII